MVSYLHDINSGIELIFCKNSSLSYPLHNHISKFTVGVILSGGITLTMGGTRKVYGNNETFLIPPYVPHKIDAENNYTMLSICLHKNSIEKYSTDSLNSAIAILIKDCFSIECPITSFNILKLISTNQIYHPRWIKEIIKQIELNPENELSIDNLAISANKSKYNFIRQFKKETGLTPHHFKIQNMVRTAQRLLDTNVTIAETALTAGFYDQSHFIRHFKRITGLTPSAYKISSISI